MSTDAMRAAALKIVAAYDAYRHRGMAPAPGEYAGVVAAIEEARAALAQPTSAERVPLTDEAAPVATDARGMLEFLSARFKHAGVSEAVAESYARDIDAILAAEAQPARMPLTDDQIVDASAPTA